MPDESPLDPAKLMRAFFTAWDQGRAPAPASRATAGTATDAIAPAMRLMAQALAVANMPSREDVGEIARRLDRIETMLGRIELRLAALETTPPPVDPAAPGGSEPARKKRAGKKR